MMKKIILLIVLLFTSVLDIKAQSTDNELLVKEYFEAYNQHKVDEIVEMVPDDFTMYGVSSDTMTVDIKGKEDLRKWLTDYFEGLPNVFSAMSNISESGNYVSFIETAHWGERRSQSSLAVYEIRDSKIHRVWYYY